MSSICEFGQSDPDVSAINDELGTLLEKAFERQVRAGVAAGEIDASHEPRVVARYLSTMTCGIKVAAHAGSSARHLTGVVRLAVRTLRAR